MDLNKIAKIEKAIRQKYGELAIANPKSFWTQEKEEAYLLELKELYQEDIKNKEYNEKINKDGFLVAKNYLIEKEIELVRLVLLILLIQKMIII